VHAGSSGSGIIIIVIIYQFSSLFIHFVSFKVEPQKLIFLNLSPTVFSRA